MMIPAGVVIVLAIVVPWYAAQYARHGWTYIVSFVVGENLARYTEGLGVNADRAFWFYVPVVFTDAFPLSILGVAAAIWWFRDRAAGMQADPSHRIRSLAVDLDHGDRRVLLDLRGEAGSLHLSGRSGRGGARRRRDRAIRRRRSISAAAGARGDGDGDGWSSARPAASAFSSLLNRADSVYSLQGIATVGGLAIAGGALTVDAGDAPSGFLRRSSCCARRSRRSTGRSW